VLGRTYSGQHGCVGHEGDARHYCIGDPGSSTFSGHFHKVGHMALLDHGWLAAIKADDKNMVRAAFGLSRISCDGQKYKRSRKYDRQKLFMHRTPSNVVTAVFYTKLQAPNHNMFTRCSPKFFNFKTWRHPYDCQVSNS